MTFLVDSAIRINTIPSLRRVDRNYFLLICSLRDGPLTGDRGSSVGTSIVRKFAAPLCALCLLFQTITHALAEECDCAKHKAAAAGPGACSLSESESWCQTAFRSMALQEIVVSALGQERAEVVFQNVPDVYVDLARGLKR